VSTPDRIGLSSKPVPHPSVVGVELDGEAVLYHQELNTVHVLDPIATIIWNHLDMGDLGSLARELAVAFEANGDVVTADLLDGVRTFGRQGLLLGVEPDPDAIADNLVEDPSEPREA
jgi:hypothetical protein